jgi:ribonuclease J
MHKNEVPKNNEKKSNGNGHNRNAIDNKKFAKTKNKTKYYKHVELDRSRPKLSRGKFSSDRKQGGNKSVNRNFVKSKKDPRSKLKIIPLGGLDAIGKNMTAFECNGDILLDDAGIMFPEDDHPGIDLILPDYTYILENANKLRGIVITHGHEDHTGSLPYLMKDLGINVPIYATKLTLGLIEGKFKEHGIKNARLVEVKSGDERKIGSFRVEFFDVNHSIPGSVGLFIQSPAGNVLHTGDFKLDQTPIDGVLTDFSAITRFADKGVDLLMSDSTNAANPGFTPSEAEVGSVLREVISKAKGRVIIAAFASHIHRLQQICDAAIMANRKVVVTGRSMIQNTDIARELGYLHIGDNDLIDAYELDKTKPDKVVIMCTGSQGEPLSALSRIANGEHKTIDIEPEDTVIISATPVPGNEKAVTKVINMLSKIGCDVYDKSKACVHVSGHASAEELKLMLALVKPAAFMPVHGEATHLRSHANLALKMGMTKDDIYILDNGDCLELSAKGIRQVEGVASGIVYVDGLSVGDTSQDVLDDRSTLGTQGFACVSVAINNSCTKLMSKPVVEMKGITGGDDKSLCKEATCKCASSIEKLLSHKDVQPKSVKLTARDCVSQFLWEKTKQKPMIIVNVLKI